MAHNTLFKRFARDFVGIAPPSQQGRRVYFDAAATSLMPRIAFDALSAYHATACSNPHTNAHLGGRATTMAVAEARIALAALLTADLRTHAVMFLGSGATAAINRVAQAMCPTGSRSKRDLVICTELEHHANMLPWARQVGSKNVLYAKHAEDGSIDMRSLRALLSKHGPRVRVVACTWASNVTGAVAPVGEIAKLAHKHGAMIVVDAAQAAPHLPVTMFPDGEPLDALALSGHKLFAPGAPGVLVARRDLFSDVIGDVGGGAVKSVSLDGVVWHDAVEEREESGTPNVPGIITLGAVAMLLQQMGMHELVAYDHGLTMHLLKTLRSVPKLHVYGSDTPGGLPRVGTVSFNLTHMPHGLVATVLSDYYNIAVRNACFCAQPFVRSLLVKHKDTVSTRCGGGPEVRQGMIRASLGPWNTIEDIDALGHALRWISSHQKQLCASYVPNADGAWVSAQQPHPGSLFSISAVVQRYMGGR